MLQIAVCDNCVEDSQEIRSLVEEVLNGYAIRFGVQEFETGEELLDSPTLFDLIFMDAALEGEDGIEIGKRLYCRNRSTRIIFQSHSKEYCEDAVNKSHAFAFLEKPVKREALEGQLRDFLDAWGNAQDAWVSLGQASPVSPGNLRQMVRLPVRDILYFECQKNGKTIKAVTERGDFIYQGVFSDIEERMEPFGFTVCNRGILINLNKIARLEGYEITMTNGMKLPLSQRRNTAFKEKVQEFYYNPIGKKHGGGVLRLIIVMPALLLSINRIVTKRRGKFLRLLLYSLIRSIILHRESW
ncbi:MAG: LytTR family DNA-binding domain-containing protein [Acetatifactor sp.]|nr:LytTR family DNA-binding domain-containing protein [Acetatifactor sp.]